MSGVVEIIADFSDVGLEDLAVGIEILHHAVEAEGLAAVDTGNDEVFILENITKVLHEVFAVEELAHHNALLFILIAVYGRNAAFSRAVGLIRKPCFLKPVERNMVRHDDDGAVGYHEI